jgi:hypothetical protein
MHVLPQWAGKDDSAALEKDRKKFGKADFENMEQTRGRIDKEIDDPEVA